MAVIGERRAKFSPGLLPLLVLALLLQAPSASARRWDGSSTEDVKVPWIGTSALAVFANATGYWNAHCAVDNPSVTGGTSAQASAHASTVGHADTPMIDRFLERHPAPVYYDRTRKGSTDLNVEIASLSAAAAGLTVKRISPTTDNFLVYLVGGNTAVIWIHQFSPSDAVTQALKAKKIDEEQYMITEYPVLNSSFTSHFILITFPPFRYLPFPPSLFPCLFPVRSSGASQIIIDVRGNGGGRSHRSSNAHVPPHAPPPPVPPSPRSPSPSRSGASQIILDVRGNGGGSVLAAYTAIRLLMGAAKVPDSAFAMPMDFIIGTQYTENAMSALSLDPSMLYCFNPYVDLNGTDLSSVFSYAPFRELRFTKAGPVGNYSAPFKKNSKFSGKGQQPVFGDRPFLVLSDGNCFSACSILTHVLGKRHKVPMVTVGGLPNQPPDVGSSCLGFTIPDIYAMAPGLSNLAALVPKMASLPLKVKGSVGMAFTNGYVDSEIPCEFEFLPSQHHINYTVDLIDKPWAIWSEVAKLFASPAA
ncbi:unnamed protein product [Closterium sp. Naga37s-1]|nr:unnamed protein product [Closterium sp. Naga37s-1]